MRRRRSAVDRVGAPAEAQEGRGVAVERGAHRTREAGAHDGVQVAREQDGEQVLTAKPCAPSGPVVVDQLPAQRSSPEPPHERLDVPHRIAREARTAGPAERAKHARHRLEGLQVQRARPARLDHGVEHEPLDVRGMGEGVPECDLRPVRRAEQSDALVAERQPERLDVLGAVTARVGGAPRPEPRGTAARGGPASSRLARSSARQRSSPDLPVPRWSKTIRSRCRYAG